MISSGSRSSGIDCGSPASEVVEDIVAESPLILALSSDSVFGLRRLTILCFRFLPVLDVLPPKTEPENEELWLDKVGRVQ